MASTKKHSIKKQNKRLKRKKEVAQKKILEKQVNLLEVSLKNEESTSIPFHDTNIAKPVYKIEHANSVVNYIADRDGCGYFRCIWPAELLATYKKVSVQTLSQYVFDKTFLSCCKTLRFQRHATNEHKAAWDSYRILRKNEGFHYNMHYEIDDLLMEIEPTNKVAYDFFNDERKNNHLYMLHTADKIVFSTEALKDIYTMKYGIDPNKIEVVKNTLPQFMFKMPARVNSRQFWLPEIDDSNPDNNIVKRDEDGNVIWRYLSDTAGNNILNGFGDKVRMSNKKPRIYWSGSASHLGQGGDLEFLTELVTKTIDEYQWVFHGVIPKELMSYAKEGKIEFISWNPVYALPTIQFYRAQPDICLAPLKAGIFNQCKSDLKFLEACALGAPCITSTFEGTGFRSPYEDNAEICIENDVELWKAAIDHLLDNPNYYMEVVKSQYKVLNGRWMENYLDVWGASMLT